MDAEVEEGMQGRHMHIRLLLLHLIFSISPLPYTLPDQSGPIRVHSRRKGRKRREGEQERQEKKKDVSVLEVSSTQCER